MRTARRPHRGLLATAALFALAAPGMSAQEGELPDRPFLDRIPVPGLEFDAVAPDEYEVAGVTVFHIPDDALPIMNLAVRFDGGYANLPREFYAAGTGMPALLRSGGTADYTADALDESLEFHAVQLTVGGSGGAITSSMNVLVEQLDTALTLWGSMLGRAAFDTAAVAVWAGRELEAIRRRTDDPGSLAFAEYNRLMYGDHPIGWELEESDFAPDRISADVFSEIHRRILCPANLLVGVTGPLPWAEVAPRIERLIADLPECGEPVAPSPIPDVRDEPGVWIIPGEIDQATLVVTQPVDLPQSDSEEYFASRIGNAILGASGLSSRLNQKLRTELGYTYGAASVWTTPLRWRGLMGATTRVRPEVAVEALAEILEVIERLRTEPPSEAEIAVQVEESVNGWVFNFESPSRILGRTMSFRAAELPDDWLSRYLDGISAVTPEQVRAVFERVALPGRWVVLVVGDPERIGPGLEAFGPITEIEIRPEG